MCGAYLGLLLVVVFPSSVLEVLPFSFWEKNFMVPKTRLTACISRFPVFSFLSPVEHFFCEIFLSMFFAIFSNHEISINWNAWRIRCLPGSLNFQEYNK